MNRTKPIITKAQSEINRESEMGANGKGKGRGLGRGRGQGVRSNRARARGGPPPWFNPKKARMLRSFAMPYGGRSGRSGRKKNSLSPKNYGWLCLPIGIAKRVKKSTKKEEKSKVKTAKPLTG